MFPSRVQVFRSLEMTRHIVAVHGYYPGGVLWGCIATGATAAEAENKALAWTWANVERHAAAGCLQARMALLERALVELLETIRAGG